MIVRNGACPSRKGRGGRAILGARPAAVEVYVSGLEIDEATLAEAGVWGNRLAAAAKLWAARGGYGQRGQITRRDAEIQWRMACAGGGE